ncbi:hypothetical protein JST56_05550 [Candidatus Dependentiae bacterium]|nr:hypothetical protein [Candidatus Dependentiae bacterium]
MIKSSNVLKISYLLVLISTLSLACHGAQAVPSMQALIAQATEQDGAPSQPNKEPTSQPVGSGQVITAVPRGYKAHSATLQYVSTVRGGDNALIAGVTKEGKALLFKGKQWDPLGNKSDFQSCEISGDGTIWGLDKNGGVWRFEKNNWIQFPGVKAQQISVGTKDEVYIVTMNNQILRRADAANPPKNKAQEELALWRALPDSAAYVAAGGDGSVWKIDARDLALYRFFRGDKKWIRVIKPAEVGLGNPKSIVVMDKFNILFVDYQGRIWKRVTGAQGTKADDWQLLSDFKTAQASIGYEGTIVSTDEKGTVLERIPLTQEIRKLDEARGTKVIANQITRLTSKWDGRRVWTHGSSARDPQDANPIPNNHSEILVGSDNPTKDPRPEQACFFMFTKKDNPNDRTELTFGSTVEIWSLYAALGVKTKAGGLGKSWKWWVPANHYDPKIVGWNDIVVSLVANPNTQNGSQVFRLSSPYGLTGAIRSNDVVEIESLAPVSQGRKVCVNFSSRWKQGYFSLTVPQKNSVDPLSSQQWFGSKDRGGTQIFSIETITDESALPTTAKQAYRSIAGTAPATQASAGSKLRASRVTAGLGILDEVVNKSEYAIQTSIGNIAAYDAKQHVSYELSNPFSIAGYAREREILNFDSSKMLMLRALWSQGVAWIAESLQNPGNTTVTFLARASDDGNIQVIFGDRINVNYMFRVIIGADGNSKSLVKMGDKILAEAKGNINNMAKAQPGRFIPYWVSLNNNFLTAGIGAPGDNVFLSAYIPLKEQPNRVGFSSDAERIEYTEIQFGEPLVSQTDTTKYPVPQKTISLSGKQGSLQMSDYILRVPNEGTLQFNAKAQNDLTTVFQNEKGDGYRIVIGGDSNTTAKVFKNNDLALSVNIETMPFGKLETTKNNSIWVSIDGGLIMAGQGKLGENIFLVWEDNNPIDNVAKIGWVIADHPQTISNVLVASSVGLGAQKQKFSYKKPIQRFKYKGSVFIIKQYTYELVQDGPRVTLTVFGDRAKTTGTPYAIAKTPMRQAKYPLRLDIDPTGVPLVYQTAFPTEPPAKIALEIAAEVADATGDASISAAASISGGADAVSSMVALGLKTAMAGAGVAAKAGAAGTKGMLKHTYRSHDSYVFTENVQADTSADASVPPEAERNAELINMMMMKMAKLNATYAPQFEELVTNYEEIIRRANHPYVVSDSATKLSIFDGISRMCTVYKTQQDYRLQDLFMNMLIHALSNTYLINPENKQDQAARDTWYKTILEISTDVFKFAKKDTAINLQPLFGEYVWFPAPLPLEDDGMVIFEANALGDVFVGFAQEPFRVRNTDNKLYEVTLGGWENTRHVIRIKSLGKSAKTLTKEENPDSMFRQNKFEAYWVSLKNGLVRIGKGAPGKNMIMEWQDPFPWKGIKYVGFSNWDIPITLRNVQVGRMSGKPAAQAAAPTATTPEDAATQEQQAGQSQPAQEAPDTTASEAPVTQPVGEQTPEAAAANQPTPA